MTLTLRSVTTRLIPGPPAPANRKRPRVRAAARPGLEQLEDRWLLSVTINVDAALNQHAINPSIYGVTYAGTSVLTDLNATLNRSGGTPTSTYNWQVNASNRGKDFYFESLSDGSATAGAFVDNFITTSKAGGAEPVITVPTLGR